MKRCRMHNTFLEWHRYISFEMLKMSDYTNKEFLEINILVLCILSRIDILSRTYLSCMCVYTIYLHIHVYKYTSTNIYTCIFNILVYV